MKKLLLTLILTFISTSAMAEWTLVSGSDGSGGYDVYADLSTIRKTDNGVRMWNLSDYKTVQEVAGDKLLSQRILDEYDCKNEKVRMLTFTFHSDNMANGETVYTNSDATSWEYIAPDTVVEALYKVACGKK